MNILLIIIFYWKKNIHLLFFFLQLNSYNDFRCCTESCSFNLYFHFFQRSLIDWIVWKSWYLQISFSVDNAVAQMVTAAVMIDKEKNEDIDIEMKEILTVFIYTQIKIKTNWKIYNSIVIVSISHWILSIFFFIYTFLIFIWFIITFIYLCMMLRLSEICGIEYWNIIFCERMETNFATHTVSANCSYFTHWNIESIHNEWIENFFWRKAEFYSIII